MNRSLLAIGDTFTILLTTLLGFITHGESNITFLPRFLVTFIPLTLAWFLLAPWFGLFQPVITSNPKQLWRVLLAMLFAAPLAVTVRSALLASNVQPIFVLVIGSTSTLGLVLWRGLYFLVLKLKS